MRQHKLKLFLLIRSDVAWIRFYKTRCFATRFPKLFFQKIFNCWSESWERLEKVFLLHLSATFQDMAALTILTRKIFRLNHELWELISLPQILLSCGISKLLDEINVLFSNLIISHYRYCFNICQYQWN